MSIDRDRIEEALDVLRPGLDADGFDLSVESIKDDGLVNVALTATPEACMDCLVPDEMMVSMIEGTMKEKEPAVDRVALKKVNFEGLEA